MSNSILSQRFCSACSICSSCFYGNKYTITNTEATDNLIVNISDMEIVWKFSSFYWNITNRSCNHILWKFISMNARQKLLECQPASQFNSFADRLRQWLLQLPRNQNSKLQWPTLDEMFETWFFNWIKLRRCHCSMFMMCHPGRCNWIYLKMSISLFCSLSKVKVCRSHIIHCPLMYGYLCRRRRCTNPRTVRLFWFIVISVCLQKKRQYLFCVHFVCMCVAHNT